MEFFNQALNLPIQKIESDLLKRKQVNLSILRLDNTDNAISGNKYFKLKFNLLQAKQEGKTTLLTFGGSFSNHIAATAAAGKLLGFKTIGIIRGEEHLPLNQTLKEAKDNGMKIHYMDRSTYKNKHRQEIIDKLKIQYGDVYIIPEGGTNELAIKGTREIIHYIPEKFDFICCAIGTGGTIAGIIKESKAKIIGFSALKGDFAEEMVDNLLNKKYSNWKVINNYHFGGFGKIKPELIQFINNFENKHQIPLEQVYTGKMLFGIFDLIEKNYFKPNSNILAIHSGGLQGKLL